VPTKLRDEPSRRRHRVNAQVDIVTETEVLLQAERLEVEHTQKVGRVAVHLQKRADPRVTCRHVARGKFGEGERIGTQARRALEIGADSFRRRT